MLWHPRRLSPTTQSSKHFFSRHIQPSMQLYWQILHRGEWGPRHQTDLGLLSRPLAPGRQRLDNQIVMKNITWLCVSLTLAAGVHAAGSTEIDWRHPAELRVRPGECKRTVTRRVQTQTIVFCRRNTFAPETTGRSCTSSPLLRAKRASS